MRVAKRAEAGLEHVLREQRPRAVVDGDDGRAVRDLDEAGAHRVGARGAAFRDEQRLGVVERHELVGEAHRVRRVQHDDDAVHAAHVEQAVHRMREDRLAAEQQELLGLPVGQPHPPAVTGGGDDDPGLPGLLILHVHPLPISVQPAAKRSRG